jgi:AmmeMemoRadiSam system protein A
MSFPDSSSGLQSGPARILGRHGEALLALAFASIRHGLETNRALAIDPLVYPAELVRNGASFVTLKRGGRLRGCIGSFTAHRPLVEDVADNAFAAAFRDSRFDPLHPGEADTLCLAISLLGPAEAIACESEEDLAAALRPGTDGLILEENGRRALYLPSVWEQLPDPLDFIRGLRKKANIEEGAWWSGIRAFRFVTESVSSADGSASKLEGGQR